MKIYFMALLLLILPVISHAEMMAYYMNRINNKHNETSAIHCSVSYSDKILRVHYDIERNGRMIGSNGWAADYDFGLLAAMDLVKGSKGTVTVQPKESLEFYFSAFANENGVAREIPVFGNGQKTVVNDSPNAQRFAEAIQEVCKYP